MSRSRAWTVGVLAATLAGAFAPLAVAGKGGGGGGGAPAPSDPAIACDLVRKSGQADLIVMDADGSNQRVLVAGAGQGNALHAAWSPDGTHVAFNGTGSGPGIYTVNVDGTGLSRIVATAAAAGTLAWSPAASPDGAAKIVFTSGDEDLWLANVDGSGLRNLTGTSARGEFDPTWSPDGAHIAAVRTGGNGGAGPDLVVFDLGVDGGGNVVIVGETSLVVGVAGSPLRGSSNTLRGPDWSRDGTRIAIGARLGGGQEDVYVIDLTAPAAARNVTSAASADDGHATWSPDDGRLAFRHRNLGAGGSKNDGLYTIAADGTGVAALAKGAYWNPSWRR